MDDPDTRVSTPGLGKTSFAQAIAAELGRGCRTVPGPFVSEPDGLARQIDEVPAGLGAYFSGTLHASWTGGLRVLADTVGGGLRVAVGGLMWWLLLAAAFVTVRHHLRKARLS